MLTQTFSQRSPGTGTYGYRTFWDYIFKAHLHRRTKYFLPAQFKKLWVRALIGSVWVTRAENQQPLMDIMAGMGKEKLPKEEKGCSKKEEESQKWKNHTSTTPVFFKPGLLLI